MMNAQPAYLHLVPGFNEWFAQMSQHLIEFFKVPEVESEFETLEDFGLEVYLTIRCGE